MNEKFKIGIYRNDFNKGVRGEDSGEKRRQIMDGESKTAGKDE